MSFVGRLVAWSAVVGTAAALVLVPRGHEHVMTYANFSTLLGTADVVAALALMGACVVGLLLQPRRPGLVALGLAALVWTAQDWAGWIDGPGLAPAVGLSLTPLLVPLLVHVVLASGRTHRPVQLALVGLYAAAVAVGLAYALFYSPFLDENCWNTCLAENEALVTARPGLVRGVAAAWLLVMAVTGIALAAIATRWGISATSAALRVRGPAIAAALALGGVLLTQSVVRWRVPRVDPRASLDAGLYFALAASVMLVAATWAYGPLLDRWTRRGVARLVSGLSEAAAAGTVARVIASATGDPSVRVVYRLPSSGGYADAEGHPVARPRSGPEAVPVLRDGQELAVILHDPDMSTSDGVSATMGLALMLALDNERLRAEALAQVAALRASRARVVETGDAERRQLERNLHDGAQQRILALSFDLRRAVAGARSPEAREMLSLAEAEARTALVELRDLAHGIFPAVLEEAGLAPALASLADRAPLPVEVFDELRMRLPPIVERTAYVVVRDAVALAAATGSEGVTVMLTEVAGELVVEVGGAGSGPLESVEDRVAGAGGHVVLAGDRLRAVIPCAS